MTSRATWSTVSRGRRSSCPSKYLYDALGSHLFEAICELPWYKITRGEAGAARARARCDRRPDREPASLIELGGGSGEKIAILVDALVADGREVRVHLVDISPTALEFSYRTLSRHGAVDITRYEMAYRAGLGGAVAGLDADGPAMVLFLGSNIGNLAPAEAHRFLRDIRSRLRAGDLFLLGADLIKPEAEMVLAYDDPLGVTAAFNLNLLARLNRELEADFELEQFEHRVIWNGTDSRIESFWSVAPSKRSVSRPRSAACAFERAKRSGRRALTSTRGRRSVPWAKPRDSGSAISGSTLILGSP